MKVVFLLLLFFIVGAVAKAQSLDCNAIYTGKFKTIVVSPDGVKMTTIIYRQKDKQVEENLTTGLKMEFDITWTSDCSYELSKPRFLKGALPGVSRDHILYVKIISIEGNKYKAEVSANFAEEKRVYEIAILN